MSRFENESSCDILVQLLTFFLKVAEKRGYFHWPTYLWRFTNFIVAFHHKWADVNTETMFCLLFTVAVFLHSHGQTGKHSGWEGNHHLSTSSSMPPPSHHPPFNPSSSPFSMGLYPQQQWSINPYLIQHFKNIQPQSLLRPTASWITINTLQKQQ